MTHRPRCLSKLWSLLFVVVVLLSAERIRVAAVRNSDRHYVRMSVFPIYDARIVRETEIPWPKLIASPTLDLIGDSHYSLVDFNLTNIADQLRHAIRPCKVILQLHTEWVQKDFETLVEAEHIYLNWSQRVSWEWLQSASTGTSKSLSYASTGKYVEFDVTDAVDRTLKQCNTIALMHDCDHLTFKLKTPNWRWVKFASTKFGSTSLAPCLQIVEILIPFESVAKVDGGVVLQEPLTVFSSRNTLDIICNTHMAFFEFDISSLLSIDLSESSQIFLKLHIEWSEENNLLRIHDKVEGLEAHVVSTGKAFINEKLSFQEVKESVSVYKLKRIHVQQSGNVYFGATDALIQHMLFHNRNPTGNREILQIRLTTSKFRWTKFASTEAAEFDKRPVLIQGIAMTLQVDEAIINAALALFNAVIFFLSPFFTTLLGIMLAATIMVITCVIKKKPFRIRSLSERARSSRRLCTTSE